MTPTAPIYQTLWKRGHTRTTSKWTSPSTWTQNSLTTWWRSGLTGGGPVVQYQLAARGMLMLACRSVSAVDAEYSRDWEEAAAHTKNTHSLEDMLKVSRTKTATPLGLYSELKLNIGTYCGLLWSLFGENCDYYRELIKIYRVLDRQECFSIREAYTKEICARITWAILDDGRSFLGKLWWQRTSP